MQKLLAAVAASGARQLTGARCSALVLGEGGRVVGAVVRTAEGERSLRARRGLVLRPAASSRTTPCWRATRPGCCAAK